MTNCTNLGTNCRNLSPNGTPFKDQKWRPKNFFSPFIKILKKNYYL